MIKRYVRKCPGCGEKVGRDWRYCAYCGYTLPGESEFANEFKRLLSGFGIKIKRKPEKQCFTIKISTGKGPIIKFKSGKGASRGTASKFLKMPENPIEPKAEISKFLNEMKIKVELPGVKKMENISLLRVGESIEVRAVAKNKGYFKVLHVPKEYVLESKKFKKGVLELILRV